MDLLETEETVIKPEECSHACEVATFGRPDHCALGVVTSSSKEGNKHASTFQLRRVQEFSQDYIGIGMVQRLQSQPQRITRLLVATKEGHLYAFGLGKGGRLGIGGDQVQAKLDRGPNLAIQLSIFYISQNAFREVESKAKDLRLEAEPHEPTSNKGAAMQQCKPTQVKNISMTQQLRTSAWVSNDPCNDAWETCASDVLVCGAILPLFATKHNGQVQACLSTVYGPPPYLGADYGKSGLAVSIACVRTCMVG